MIPGHEKLESFVFILLPIILFLLIMFLTLSGCGIFCTRETCCMKPGFAEDCVNGRLELDHAYKLIWEQKKLIDEFDGKVADMNELAGILKEKLDFYDYELLKLREELKDCDKVNERLVKEVERIRAK